MNRFFRRGAVPADILWWVGGAAVAGAVSVFQIRAFREAGLGPTNACAVGEISLPESRCLGLPPSDFGDNPASREWITNLDWTTGVSQDRQIRGVQGRLKTMEIAAIADADRLPLVQLKRSVVVAARISGDPEVDEDIEYGIGGDKTKGRDLDQHFYFVIDPFDAPTVIRKLKAFQQVTIATWSLYGLTKDKGTLVKVNSGELKFCRDDHFPAHKQRTALAEFLRCQDALKFSKATRKVMQDNRLGEAVNAALRQRLQTASLSTIFREITSKVAGPENLTPSIRAQQASLRTLLGEKDYDELEHVVTEAAEFAPAWITCGIGCCSIDA